MKKLKLLTTKELAAKAEKPVSHIQRLARQRIIPSIVVGWRTRLFDEEAVRKALLRRTVKELN
jgi:excisionase family DNA binding protein